ncbi:MAG: hypothetical protein AAF518_14240 [Spirochaetota bacterium]
MPGKKRKYDSAFDATLTQGQATASGFRPNALEGGTFRYPSNPTLAGYNSGYHEAAVTTDTFKFLRAAKNLGNGEHRLPTKVSNRSYFYPYRGKIVDSSILQDILALADGYRTDTAQTILSGPNATAAGHTHSNLKTTGQSKAHDLLRKAIIDLLETPPGTAGFSKRAIGTLFGTITVTSMAPGEVARRIQGGTASLRNQSEIPSWEERRNNAKRRVHDMYQPLNSQEKEFVRQGSRRFMDSLGDPNRRLRKKRATSPERNTKTVISGEVGGGKYLKKQPKSGPSLKRPSNEKDNALFMTQDFRAERRKIKKAKTSLA